MAKDKKAFLMYADQKDLFEELSDEEAGRLIKHIMRYVNDENPVAPDRITKISFTPIQKQLKRDLKSYEEIRQKRAEYGKKGGQRSAEARSKTKQNEANGSNGEAKRSNTQANEAVNDNVNDTVNVNVNEINSGGTHAHAKNSEHWHGRLNSHSHKSMRSAITGKFPSATERQIESVINNYKPWFDLKFPAGGSGLNYSSWFTYYISDLKKLPEIETGKVSPKSQYKEINYGKR